MFWFGAPLLGFVFVLIIIMIVFSFNCSLIRFDLSQEQVERGPAFGFLAKCLVRSWCRAGRDRIVWISR
jgi:hypothetical protein